MHPSFFHVSGKEPTLHQRDFARRKRRNAQNIPVFVCRFQEFVLTLPQNLLYYRKIMDRTLRTYFLTLLCLLMQAVAVFPHHHHDHMFCLHNDWTQCEGCAHEHHHNGSPQEQHECEDGCVTHLQCHNQQVQAADAVPDEAFHTLLSLFTLWLKYTLVSPEEERNDETAYHERLHAVHILCGKALRAPPASEYSL